MFKLFKNKKQKEILEQLPLAKDKPVTRTKSVDMTMISVQVSWVESYKEPYFAEIQYVEHPAEWSIDKQGLREKVTIRADNWFDLIDKVNIHFKAFNFPEKCSCCGIGCESMEQLIAHTSLVHGGDS